MLENAPRQSVSLPGSIPLVTSFTYLGILVSPILTNYSCPNAQPLMTRFRVKINIWNKLNISQAGKTNLIKIILLPQLLYVLHNSPVVNPLFKLLLWGAHCPSIKLEQLQFPKDGGGLALPNPWIYYIAIQLQHLIGSMSPIPESSHLAYRHWRRVYPGEPRGTAVPETQ